MIDRLVLLSIARILPITKTDVDRYISKLDEMRSRPSFWSRSHVSEREGLRDFHSALIGLGFMVLIVVNLIGIGISSWIATPLQLFALLPVIVVGAVGWTYLLFQAVFAQLRFRTSSKNWDFTITKSPIVWWFSFGAFLGVEALFLGVI
jgi:hypothetical protein